MPNSDDDLLARLNALKQSSVSLDTTRNASIASTNPPKPTDDLAARFARLGSPSPSGSPQPSRTASTNNLGAPIVAPGAPSYLEGIAQGVGGSNVEFNEDDEKSLEELLGELNGAVGDPKEWDVLKSEQQDVGKLLKDMCKILPEVVNSRTQDAQKKGPVSKEELTDWESVEKYDPPSPAPEDSDSDSGDKKEEDTTDTGLTLPSAPSTLPEGNFDRAQAFEDDFTARLAALSAPRIDSLGLPSAPSFAPRNKPPVSTNLQKNIDEEIDTWCIICQDDATLKCLGCDDDLYCQNCWMEGHRGEAAGLEEKTHKAVLYVKKKKQKTAA
ncbi:hypothetical protein PtrSN002B_002113 [Pyrenophora tritici-repentis]|nr:hypothetical protein PtrV1_10356 [Pyrenophora tritici-repentis]KAI1556528.1 hypothetical protein PtrSN002B_002113 [Pyrenophora tritici-repentis]KAI1575845.1 hypothetical protein PtrEW4_002467 [Pyrenophora tritici-repentis]PZD30941.1 hypothetical protein A1F96_04010 [Pyrenophora tritici-repentis]